MKNWRKKILKFNKIFLYPHLAWLIGTIVLCIYTVWFSITTSGNPYFDGTFRSHEFLVMVIILSLLGFYTIANEISIFLIKKQKGETIERTQDIQ